MSAYCLYPTRLRQFVDHAGIIALEDQIVPVLASPPEIIPEGFDLYSVDYPLEAGGGDGARLLRGRIDRAAIIARNFEILDADAESAMRFGL